MNKAAAVALMAAITVTGCVQEIPSAPHGAFPVAERAASVLPVAGYLLFNQPSGAIHALRLPYLETGVVKSPSMRNGERATIHALSGPDREGRVAYIEDHFFVADKSSRRHLLKTVRIDGTQDGEVFVRSGGALWAKTPAGHGEIGSHLALSASGGLVAFLSSLEPVQLPSAYLHVGHLEVWNVVTRAGGKRLAAVLDEGLAWFPDGRRLAFVRLTQPADIPTSALPPASFGRAFQDWDRIPSVFILDLDMGTERFLATGWRPVVSGDGTFVLVSDSEGNARGVEAASGMPLALRLPQSDCPRLVAAPSPGLVLALCRPGSGEFVEYSENNSPLSGEKPMLILSLVGTDSADRRAVVRSIDPRTVVSFGTGPAKEE